jgi:hypothetical protein
MVCSKGLLESSEKMGALVAGCFGNNHEKTLISFLELRSMIAIFLI